MIRKLYILLNTLNVSSRQIGIKSPKITVTYQNLPQTDIARELKAEFTDSLRM